MADNGEIRMDMPTYRDKWADRIWKRFEGEVRGAQDLEAYVEEKLEMLDPSSRDLERIAQVLRGKVRDEAPPVLKPHARGMYK